MKRSFFSWILFLPLLLSAQKVISIKITGTINPAAAGYIHRGIEVATRDRAECLIIQLNTPGGLLESTRTIVGDILNSPVPVVVFVAPSGAHAGSAGVFLTLAADVAAMAPGTNLGAAHPVSGGPDQQDSVMSGKATNDAAAFIRTISERRHRNTGWAESAVRQSHSLTEKEALAQKVIDLIATNLEDLLRQLDGRVIASAEGDSLQLVKGRRILHTRSARIETLEMGFTEKILDLISNPNFTYILLLLGIYGLVFELYSPGAIFPGIVGVIALILAFYAMQALPVNYAGLALIVFAIILFLLEIKLVSHGVLAIGGVVSLLLGSIMLIRPGAGFGFTGISRTVIILATTLTALFFLTIIGLGVRAQKARPVTGPQALIGETGEVIVELDLVGTVRVNGEYWKAESVEGAIVPGEKVRVISVKDLKLYVGRL